MLPHVLLLICLVAAGVEAQCSDDGDMRYLQCQNELNSKLNLTDAKPYMTPDTFRYKVELFYEKSPSQGLRTVCKAFREFKGCMQQYYGQCMTPWNFVSIGASQYNAYMFISTFNTMHYTCGAGFQTYLSNQQCMMNAWSGDNSNQLYACRTSFERKSDVNKDDACLFANQYVDCWENEFLGACGNNARDTQFWGCEYARINVFTRFPGCNTRCVLPYSGGIIG